MGAFRRRYLAVLAVVLAVISAVVLARDAAAQARPRPEPRVAYQRLDSLEKAALTGVTFAERLSAVTTITSIALHEQRDNADCALGSAPSVIKFPGLVNRLASIYRQSQDRSLREAILHLMAFMVECAEAVAFLASAAEEAPPVPLAPAYGVMTDDMRSPLQAHAIAVLSRFADLGENALRRLHGQGTVRDSTARVRLEALAGQGFRRPPY